MADAILFDIDGTLLDSNALHAEAWAEVFGRHGHNVKVEDVVWDRLQAHGVAAEDLGARAAVATVMSLAFLGLALWASSDDDEPLLAVMARCLLAAPHPSRVAAGVTAASLTP